jgi:UDP-N-acetylmuramate dehydrogenase
MTQLKQNSVFENLPSIRGRYSFGHLMAQTTWFKVGGAAEIFFRPADTEDLCYFLKNKPSNLEVTCIGAGSNILVRDGGINGCVVKLGGGFSDISIEEDLVIAGAACLDRTVVMKCQEAGLSGLEFLVGVPGTIGGALAMNAGAYESETKDFLEWFEFVDQQGELHRLYANEIHMTYRHGNLPAGSIVVRAAFKCTKKDSNEIRIKVSDYLQKREDSQPIRGRTGGSTFKNPQGSKAWELIDLAGCRGLRIGDAQVSEKHCNFLLNLDAARANDIETLGTTVQKKVKEMTGQELEWEIIRIGSSL